MIEVIVLNYKSHFCLFVSGSVISNYSSPLESEYTYYFFLINVNMLILKERICVDKAFIQHTQKNSSVVPIDMGRKSQKEMKLSNFIHHFLYALLTDFRVLWLAANQKQVHEYYSETANSISDTRYTQQKYQSTIVYKINIFQSDYQH